MNDFIKQIIEEKFASKAQQRYFFSQANKKGKKGKKWSKMAKEFSKETDFDKLPEKSEKDIDEIVDDKGNISRSKKPTNLNSKGVTEKNTTDDVVLTGGGSMGNQGVHGTFTSLKYWAESDMSKSLGYKDTLGNDEDIEDAEEHFEKELGLDKDEAKTRLNQMGYDENLPDEKVRLVENPRKFMEDYIESILRNKSKDNDMVRKYNEDEVVKKINPVIKKQIKSLNKTLKKNNLNIDDVIKYLKTNE